MIVSRFYLLYCPGCQLSLDEDEFEAHNRPAFPAAFDFFNIVAGRKMGRSPVGVIWGTGGDTGDLPGKILNLRRLFGYCLRVYLFDPLLHH